jgi:HEPN domain-containing protein
VRERYAPDDPREWLNRAYSDLTIARAGAQDVYLEDLCFHTQQAAEKAIKALLIKYKVEFPYVHDISQLLTLLERAGREIPGLIKEAEKLTRFAIFTRYPGLAPPVKSDEYEQAVAIAEQVIRWAEGLISGRAS